MTSLEDFYASVGGDASTVLSRLGGNRTLLTMLLGKFNDDDSFLSLTEAIDKGDIEASFRASHTLKGVSANLGIESLCALSSEVCEFLRGGDMKSALGLMPQLKAEYERVSSLLKTPQ